MEDINKKEDIEYAGFWIRAVASILDVVLLGIPVSIFVSVFFGFDWLISEHIYWRPETLSQIVLALLTLILWVNFRGATPGKKLMGIKIVSFPGCGKLSYTTAVIRYACYILSFLILGLGFIMVAFRKDKRGLHDLIAKTAVVYSK